MSKPLEVTVTDLGLAADAVCVLYAKVLYENEHGVVTECPRRISGIFRAWSLELPPRKDEHGDLSVYVWCAINETDDDAYWFVLKVPQHGFIELPNYTGEIISRIKIGP